MKWVELIEPGNIRVWVNGANVSFIRQYPNSTEIYFVGGKEHIQVTESADEVIAKLSS